VIRNYYFGFHFAKWPEQKNWLLVTLVISNVAAILSKHIITLLAATGALFPWTDPS